MATLTDDEKNQCRRFMATGEAVTWQKSHVNAAMQIVEDVLSGDHPITALEIGVQQGLPAYLSARIDTAASPVSFTNAQKRRLVAKVLEMKFRRDR